MFLFLAILPWLFILRRRVKNKVKLTTPPHLCPVSISTRLSNTTLLPWRRQMLINTGRSFVTFCIINCSHPPGHRQAVLLRARTTSRAVALNGAVHFPPLCCLGFLLMSSSLERISCRTALLLPNGSLAGPLFFFWASHLLLNWSSKCVPLFDCRFALIFRKTLLPNASFFGTTIFAVRLFRRTTPFTERVHYSDRLFCRTHILPTSYFRKTFFFFFFERLYFFRTALVYPNGSLFFLPHGSCLCST